MKSWKLKKIKIKYNTYRDFFINYELLGNYSKHRKFMNKK